MNKIIIGIGIIAIIAIGWLLFKSNTVNYIAEVNNEVTVLETELAEIEAAVQAGLLTPKEAAEAQTKIAARIDAVSTMVTSGQRAKYTDAQRAQLAEGLERLKQILIKYRATLTVVDSTVLELPESERPVLNRRGGGGSSNNLGSIATETIATVEDEIEDIIEEVTDEELAEELNDTISETYTPEEDETGTSTEEMASDGETSIEATNETEIGDSEAIDPNEESSEEMSEDTEEATADDSQSDENATGN